LKKLNDDSIPVLWISLEDAEQVLEGEDKKLKMLREAWDKDGQRIADIFADILWNGHMENGVYNEILTDSVEDVIADNEVDMIKQMPVNKLPLLIDTLEFDRSKAVWEKRIREGK
jgi:hypothetical protein